MSFKRLALGKTGEHLASRFLQEKGYTILVSNFKTRSGEIDIVARHNSGGLNTLVFVEVKTRRSNFLESPLVAVTTHKQKQISKVAQEYLSRNNLFNREARFDVISVTIDATDKEHIEHLENAFELCYGF